MSVNASFLQRLSNQIKENISSECDHLELYCEEGKVSLNTESAVYISVTIKKKKKKKCLSVILTFYHPWCYFIFDAFTSHRELHLLNSTLSFDVMCKPAALVLCISTDRASSLVQQRGLQREAELIPDPLFLISSLLLIGRGKWTSSSEDVFEDRRRGLILHKRRQLQRCGRKLHVITSLLSLALLIEAEVNSSS